MLVDFGFLAWEIEAVAAVGSLKEKLSLGHKGSISHVGALLLLQVRLLTGTQCFLAFFNCMAGAAPAMLASRDETLGSRAETLP